MSLAYLQVLCNECRPVVEEIQQNPGQNCLLLCLSVHIVLDVVLVVNCVLALKGLSRVALAVDLEELLPLVKLVDCFLPLTL